MSVDSSSDGSRECLIWYEALSYDVSPEGRGKAVSCENTTVAVTRYDEYTELDDNHPQQGGLLGQESIEAGLLWGLWHGWDFDLPTGKTPGLHDDRVQRFPADFDAMTLGKYHNINVPVWGKVGTTVGKLLEQPDVGVDTENRRTIPAEQWESQ